MHCAVEMESPRHCKCAYLILPGRADRDIGRCAGDGVKRDVVRGTDIELRARPPAMWNAGGIHPCTVVSIETSAEIPFFGATVRPTGVATVNM